MTKLFCDLAGDADGEDYSMPKYSDLGSILFEVFISPNEEPIYEVLDYDSDTSVTWLNEGMGCEYYLSELAGLDIELSGCYVLEGIHGQYFRGDGYTTDDDEVWYCGNLRRASKGEIAGRSLC